MQPSENVISVILVDPSDLFRYGCKALFMKERRFKVLEDRAQLRDLQSQDSPDVLVTDPLENRQPSVAPILSALAMFPTARLIVLTDSSDPGFLAAASALRIRGLLAKSRTSHLVLLQAVSLIATSQLLVCDSQLAPLEGTVRLRERLTSRSKSHRALTSRERDVLSLLTEGLSDDQIARRLSIAPTTVQTHIGNILRKVEVTNRVQLGLVANELLTSPVVIQELKLPESGGDMDQERMILGS